MPEYYGVQRSDEYLAHYGVLGMKWGIRRAAQKGTDYHYQSHATKKYQKAADKLAKKAKAYGIGAVAAKNNGHTAKSDKFAKKANKAISKMNKYQNRAKRSAEIDRGEEEYARNISTGKAIAGTLLGAGSVMKGYMQNRAMAGEKGKDASGKKVTSAALAAWTGSGGSRLRKAAYIRQDEKRRGPGEAIRKFDTKVRNIVSNAIDPAAQAYNRERKKKRG